MAQEIGKLAHQTASALEKTGEIIGKARTDRVDSEAEEQILSFTVLISVSAECGKKDLKDGVYTADMKDRLSKQFRIPTNIRVNMCSSSSTDRKLWQPMLSRSFNGSIQIFAAFYSGYWPGPQVPLMWRRSPAMPRSCPGSRVRSHRCRHGAAPCSEPGQPNLRRSF